MDSIARDYPGLGASHFNNARLFFDRTEMLLTLRPEKGLAICEVGVGLGQFSRFVLDHMRPRIFVAIDSYDLHTQQTIWGRPAADVFGKRTHRAFYEDMFSKYRTILRVQEGQSHECLATWPDAEFDILYIDAGHTYEDIKRDAAMGSPKVKQDGLLVFNDYTLYDHFGSAPYGVVQAVNELIVASDWQVVGFSLQREMYCDIALKRREVA